MAELYTIVCDGYDRDVLSRLLANKSALRKTRERLERLIPHAEPLLCDLFCTLFKLNVTLRDKDELSAAVLLNHRLVRAVIGNRELAELRKRTELDEDECAAALPSLVERILIALKREFHFSPGQLLEASEVAQDEAELDRRERELEHLEELPEGAFDDAEKEALVDDLERDIGELRQRIADARARQDKMAEKLTSELDESVSLKLSVLPDQLKNAGEQMKAMGLGSGQHGKVGAAKRMELGERLMRSRKLQLLAKLVGAFREVAFEARRKRVVRSPQELHEVGMGAHLDRLLPSELLGLPRHQGALHTEFLRRMVEGQLLEYELHGASSRGPMVVCVDGSGSMHGSKELWSKAVALTLMEIARREKRRCLAIIFSAGHELFEIELLGKRSTKRARAEVLDDNVLSFAEHFPGGGTNFQEPLRRALDAVAAGEYRRGDIVFITDGHAHVSDELVREIDEKRKKHRFRVRGIVVDVADSSRESLDRFCDDVRQVTDLAADSLGDLFASV